MSKLSPSNIRSPISPAVAEELVENQTKQLELAGKQLEFQREVQKNNFEYAKLALQEKMNSQHQDNQVEMTLSKWKYFFLDLLS